MLGRIFSFGRKNKSVRTSAPEIAHPGVNAPHANGYHHDDYADPYSGGGPPPHPGQDHAHHYEQSLPATMPEPAPGWLTVHGLKKSYGRKQVVKGVSLSMRRGEAVGLLGPNGAGKTTVFYIITGLIAADSGHVMIDALDVTRLPMYRRSRLGVGYLPQEASIFRGLTVEQNIRAVLELVERKRKNREQRLNELISEFNLGHVRKSKAVSVSGGERRRLEIARALATNPSYILLDEPFAGVDPVNVSEIRGMVRYLTQKGIGVLITDHNVRETLKMIDRAYILHDGMVLTEGTPNQVITNKAVRDVYLGEHYD